jgi:hypothetical protein
MNDEDIFELTPIQKTTHTQKPTHTPILTNMKTDNYYEYFRNKYYIKFPVYYLFNWCSIYELLLNNNIKLYDSSTRSIHICSNEESSYMALDAYYFTKYGSIINPEILNLNITKNIDSLEKIKKLSYKKTSIIIFNCSNQFDCETDTTYDLHFTYRISKIGPLYKMQFNYKGEYLILTIYYKFKSIKFKTEEAIKILGVDVNKKCIIERKHKEHKYKIHKKTNPLDHHMHFKIPIKKDIEFIKGVFKLYGFNTKSIDEHITNILNKKQLKKININNICFNANDYYYNLQYYIGFLLLCNVGGTLLYKISYPLNIDFDYILFDILNKSFDTFRLYRPTFMFDTKTIYIVCKNYHGIDNLHISKEDIAKLFLKIQKRIPLKKLLKNYVISKELIKLIDDTIETIDKKNKMILDNINKNDKDFAFNLLKKWFIKYKIPIRK